MSQSTSIPEPATDAARADTQSTPAQSVLISIVSLAVIAVTAVLLHWLPIPSEVSASLATASGALVPLIVMRRRDRKKGKAESFDELASGTFERPFPYVLFTAAGLLTLLLAAGSAIMLAPLLGSYLTAQGEGLLTIEEIAHLNHSSGVLGSALTIGPLIGLASAAIVGVYVAHRLPRHDLWCGIRVVVLTLLVFVADLLLTNAGFGLIDARLVPSDISTYLYSACPAGAIGIVLGVLLGRRTRPMFLVNRLFKGLSRSDQGTVLEIMKEAQSDGRIPTAS